MPQQDAFGRVTRTPSDDLQSQAIDFMTRQALANQQAQVQREAIQSGERLGNRGFDTQLATQGLYSQRANQETAMQTGKYAGETGLETLRGTNAVNLQHEANVGNLSNTMQLGQNATGLEGVRGTNAVNLMHEGNVPALAELDFNRHKYDDTSPAIKAKADSEATLARLQARFMEDAMGGAVNPAAGPTQAPGAAALGGPPRSAQPGHTGMTEANRMKIFGSLMHVPGLGEDPVHAAVQAKVAERIASAPDPYSAENAFNSGGGLPSTVTPDQVSGMLPAALADYTAHDSSAGQFFGDTAKAAGAAATAGAGVGAGLGLFTGGALSVPFAAAGAVGSGLAAAAGTAFGKLLKSAPTPQAEQEIRSIMAKLVDAFARQNGGDMDMAKLQAKAVWDDTIKKGGLRSGSRTTALRSSIGGP